MIRSAQGTADYATFGALINDYLRWFRRRYQDDPWFADAVFSHQGLERELAGLAGMYGPPHGRTLIEAARTEGYRVMVLDSARRLTEAITLYRSLGFTECAAYQSTPAQFLPYLIFMELRL